MLGQDFDHFSERKKEGGTGGGQKRVMYCIHTSLCLYLFVVRWLSVGMTYWGKSRVHDDLQHTWKLRFESFKNVEAKTCLSGLKFAQHVTHRPLNTHADYTDKRFVYTLKVDYSDYTRLYIATTHYTASGGGERNSRCKSACRLCVCVSLWQPQCRQTMNVDTQLTKWWSTDTNFIPIITHLRVTVSSRTNVPSHRSRA